MLIRFLVVCALVLLSAAVIWVLHGVLLLPIRKGSCGSIEIVVSAHGEAPELEMQLRGLFWLRSNGIIPCSIRVVDQGLAPEALAALKCYSKDKGIIVSCERGTDENG